MEKTYALSSSKRFLRLTDQEKDSIWKVLQDCGVKNFSIDYELLFTCDDAYAQTLLELAMKWGFNLITYGRGIDQ